MVVEVDRRRTRKLGGVGPRGEGALRAAEDDAAHGFVVVELLEHARELLHQLVRERIQRVRPVEEDDCDRLLALQEDEITHFFFFSRKRLIAAFGSSVAMESASQSRAWLIVSCQARSFQKFRCCFA